MTQNLTIDFWDVGQGDATVIRLPDDDLVVIDTGPLNSPLVNWFRRKKRHVRDFLITHNDADHIGALPSILNLTREGLLTFDSIRMVPDRGYDDETTKSICSPLWIYEDRTDFLGQGAIVWEDSNLGLKLRAVHPSVVKVMTRKGVNQKSAIVILEHLEEVLVCWPGDAKFSAVFEKLPRAKTEYLLGPHHGGPEDRGYAEFPSNVAGVSVGHSLISTGSFNTHGHPDPDFLRLLQEHHPCRITCTQITSKCDAAIASSGNHVFDGTQALGLVPSPTGTRCRGCFRLVWNPESSALEFNSKYFEFHQARIDELAHPMCR
jgi:competence protein ComEC